MKLVIQIAFGVFFGALAAGLTLDVWRDYRQTQVKKAVEEVKARRQQARHEEGERIRALLLQGRQNIAKPAQSGRAADFIPDDAKPPKPLPPQN